MDSSLFRFENGIKEINPEIGLHWAGWYTTTYRLQHAGWKVVVDEDPRRQSLRFYLRYNERVWGFSQDVSYTQLASYGSSRLRTIELPVSIGNEMKILQTASNFFPDNLKEVGRPGLVFETDFEELSMDSFRVFQQDRPEEEILAEEKDIESLLQEIIDKQKPRQEDIRRRIMKEQAKTKVSAQIITLVA